MESISFLIRKLSIALKKEDNVICQACHSKIDYGKEPEAGMGYIKCPKCKKLIDQTGKVLHK